MVQGSGHRIARAGTARRVLRSALVAAILGPAAIGGGVAAFGATVSGDASLTTGTVYLTTDGGAPMFSLPSLRPGSTATSYATLTSEGSLPVTVRLFASVSGTGLAPLLEVIVTRGTGRGAAFTPDATDREGDRAGVVFQGSLADFPQDWSAGVPDPGIWTAGESHTYRFEVEMPDRRDAQGLTATVDFQWGARVA